MLHIHPRGAAMQDLKVDYRTDPARYRHWKLSVDGRVARLALDVAEDGGIRDGLQAQAQFATTWASTSSSTTRSSASVSSIPTSVR